MPYWQRWLIEHIYPVGCLGYFGLVLLVMAAGHYLFHLRIHVPGLFEGFVAVWLIAWNPLTSQIQLLPGWRRRLPVAIAVWVAALVLGSVFSWASLIDENNSDARHAYEREMRRIHNDDNYLEQDWYRQKIHSFESSWSGWFPLLGLGALLCWLAYSGMIESHSTRVGSAPATVVD